MSKQYGCLPSELLGIEDDYTAFCFNEACCCIMCKLEKGEEPKYIEDREQEERERTKPKEYHSFEDYYKQFGG